jgi:uncharacterized membrane protein YoaK (UPF0700 family)
MKTNHAMDQATQGLLATLKEQGLAAIVTPAKPKPIPRTRQFVAWGLCVVMGWVDIVSAVRFSMFPGMMSANTIYFARAIVAPEFAGESSGVAMSSLCGYQKTAKGVVGTPCSPWPGLYVFAILFNIFGVMLRHAFKGRIAAAMGYPTYPVALQAVLCFTLFLIADTLNYFYRTEWQILLVCLIAGMTNAVGSDPKSWLGTNVCFVTGNYHKHGGALWTLINTGTVPEAQRTALIIPEWTIFGRLCGAMFGSLYFFHAGPTFSYMPVAFLQAVCFALHDIEVNKEAKTKVEVAAVPVKVVHDTSNSSVTGAYIEMGDDWNMTGDADINPAGDIKETAWASSMGPGMTNRTVFASVQANFATTNAGPSTTGLRNRRADAMQMDIFNSIHATNMDNDVYNLAHTMAMKDPDQVHGEGGWWDPFLLGWWGNQAHQNDALEWA